MSVLSDRLRIAELVLLLSLASGCGSSPAASGGASGGAAGNGGSPANVGAGVGAPCVTSTCRSGLSCDHSTKTCLATHATPIGRNCLLDDECVAGAYCDPDHSCAAAGSLASGDACYGDGACQSGFRCVLTGLSATCQPEGTGDLATKCTTTADCKGGLSCTSLTCQELAAGTPIFGHSQWQGETCPADSASKTAYFHVPRGLASDGDFYRLPFPNDIRVVSGHISLAGHPTPGSNLLGYDPADLWLRAIEQGLGGFGAYPTVLFRFSAPIDQASFRGAGVVTMIDLTANSPAKYSQLPLVWYASEARGQYICENWFGVRPPEGQPLTSGHTYAVLITNAGVAADETAFHADDDLEALLADAPPADPKLAAAYQADAPLRGYLDAVAIPAATVLDAAVFTVAPVVSPVAQLASTIEGAPAPVATDFNLCGSGADPCPDTTGERACGAADSTFYELHAMLSLPVYQAGTAPYLTASNGGGINVSPVPSKPVRTDSVCMSLTIPRTAAMPVPLGWPVVLYAPDADGNYRSSVLDGIASMLASASPLPMAVLTIDQVEQGPRRGSSTADTRSLLLNLQNPNASLGNAIQGALDQLSLARLASNFSLSATVSPTGSQILLDPSTISFLGQSQGAVFGGVGVPYSAEIKGAVLSAVVASQVDRFLETTTPEDFSALFPLALEDADPGSNYELAGRDFNPILSLFQSYLDPADPLHHAHAVTDAPPMGVAPHDVFQVYGLGDTTSPPKTQASYAIAAALWLVSPDPTVISPDDIPGLMTPLAPLMSNKMSADGMSSFTAGVREYQPTMGADGHLVAFQNGPARTDILRFLSQLAQKLPPQIGQ